MNKITIIDSLFTCPRCLYATKVLVIEHEVGGDCVKCPRCAVYFRDKGGSLHGDPFFESADGKKVTIKKYKTGAKP